jgi:hypothetical protein
MKPNNPFRTRPLIISFFLILLASAATVAQNEKELVIRSARAYESAPLSKETAQMREKALRWVIETDQVSLIACGGVFSKFSDKKNKNSSDMTAAYMLGMAAFKFENPEKASDENATQLAGLESSLKAYEAIVKEKPKTKNESIEALILKRNGGELGAIVAAAECGKK